MQMDETHIAGRSGNDQLCYIMRAHQIQRFDSKRIRLHRLRTGAHNISRSHPFCTDIFLQHTAKITIGDNTQQIPLFVRDSSSAPTLGS